MENLKEMQQKYFRMGLESIIFDHSRRENPRDILSLDIIMIRDKGKRNSGLGSAFMADLVKYADSHKLKIILSPSSDFGSSKTRLVKFYKRFGFVENKGRNKDFSISDTMFRNFVIFESC